MGRVVLHLDANSFYASVELAYAPHLRGLPLSVGGDADMRHGIILASSPEAKKRGVKTGMALFQAKQFCPKLIVIKPEFDKYKRFSDRLRGMMMEYTPLVESYGLDEAWMEITNPGITLGDGCDLAALLRRHGIAVFCEDQLAELASALSLDASLLDISSAATGSGA